MNQAVKQHLKVNTLEEEKDEQVLKKSLRNKFNFQERSSQTVNNPIKSVGRKTDPPVCKQFSMETTQWMIFDAYLQAYEDIQRQDLEEVMKNKRDKKPMPIQQQNVIDPIYAASMRRALKIMERMIV
jgi:dynein intermediate chain 1